MWTGLQKGPTDIIQEPDVYKDIIICFYGFIIDGSRIIYTMHNTQLLGGRNSMPTY